MKLYVRFRFSGVNVIKILAVSHFNKYSSLENLLWLWELFSKKRKLFFKPFLANVSILCIMKSQCLPLPCWEGIGVSLLGKIKSQYTLLNVLINQLIPWNGIHGMHLFLSADYAWNYEHHFCTSVKTFNTIFEILKLLTVKNDVIWKVVNYSFSECVHTLL